MNLKRILIVIAVAVIAWVAGFGVFAMTSLDTKPQEPQLIADAIVVLTGDQKRIETGLHLLDEGRAKYLFISGVHKDVTEAEIRQMQPSATNPCCIVLGREARSTIQNGAETAAWVKSMKFKTIRLVTSNYHMNRAMLELSHAMPGVKILRNPVFDLFANNRSPRLWSLLMTEYVKISFRFITLPFESLLSLAS